MIPSTVSVWPCRSQVQNLCVPRGSSAHCCSGVLLDFFCRITLGKWFWVHRLAVRAGDLQIRRPGADSRRLADISRWDRSRTPKPRKSDKKKNCLPFFVWLPEQFRVSQYSVSREAHLGCITAGPLLGEASPASIKDGVRHALAPSHPGKRACAIMGGC